MYANEQRVMQVVPATRIEDQGGRLIATPTALTPAVQPPADTARVATTSRRRFAYDSLVVGVIGLALTIVGPLVITRAGTHGSMATPVIRVLGFTHTETLGLLEAGIGILLLIAAAATSRGSAIVFGLILGVGGFIGAFQTSSFKNSLALQPGLAWLAVILGVIVVLSSMLVPRVLTETATLENA